MIFTVVIKEQIDRIVEIQVEAPTEEIAGERALDLYELTPSSAVVLEETSYVDPNDLVITSDD